MSLLEKTALTALVLAFAACLPGAVWAQDYYEPDAQQTWQLCSACHGEAGDGREMYMAPSIAGLPEWYVQGQLTKFKAGYRGTHPADAGGLRMYPMSLTLRTPEQIAEIAAYVAAMPRPAANPVLEGGDAERGKQLFAPCTACHGANAMGNQAMGSPPLVGISDWYMLTQLKHFKARIRGGNPNDTTGVQMAGMANILPDEQAMKDVIAYIETLHE